MIVMNRAIEPKNFPENIGFELTISASLRRRWMI